MRIRLLRKTATAIGRSYPLGQVLQVTKSYGNRLIAQGCAEEYTGEYPPKKKMKTNFFKPKDK